jgi:hypothetical protein
MTKDFEIRIEEEYKDAVFDSIGKMNKKDRERPMGRVEIYEVDDDGKKKLIRKNNLVLYQGREYIAQRIVNLSNAVTDTTANEFISWLGLGEGGVDPADPFDPVAPVLTDTDLYTEVPFNATNATYADFRLGSYYKHPFDSVEFEQDPLNDDKWLIIKITVTVGVDDANGYQLSEAGLFTSDSDAAGNTGPFNLFARVTFPSIVKTDERRIIIVWYLYV